MVPLFILSLFSCSTKKPASIDSQLTIQKGSEQVKEGLRIYIRPLREPTEIKKYFGANLLEKDILPIFILVENKSESKYFLVEPEKQLQEKPKSNLNGKNIEPKNSSSKYITAKEAKNSIYEKESGLEKALILTGPIFWLAAIPLAMTDYGPTDASKSLQQALITKSLRRQTLTPGKTESGFLYYHIPPDISSEENIGIKLKATDLDTSEIIYFPFTKKLKDEEKDVKK
ncbi:hypothetical protein KJ855_00750 [Patescibacteria group bacterium]|nr:hypothetical protein [Patescibacteria group bacterium]